MSIKNQQLLKITFETIKIFKRDTRNIGTCKGNNFFRHDTQGLYRYRVGLAQSVACPPLAR